MADFAEVRLWLEMDRKLDDLKREVRAMAENLQAGLDALVERVAAVEDVVESAEVAIAGVGMLVQQLKDQLAAAGATPEQLELVNDLAARLDVQKNELAEAVANVPQE